MKKILILVVRVYKKLLSPVLVSIFGGACRFTPSCSEYTIEALDRFGSAKGLYLGLKRFLGCHPWGRSGYDPVPN